MNKYLKKIQNLISKSGFILFFLRLPSRTIKNLFIKLSSLFWKIFLKECGDNVVIELGVRFENPKNVIIKNNVYIGSNSIFGTELDEGIIVLEDHVHIGRNCKIDHTGNIAISKNTLLSENVRILSHSHGYNPKNNPIGLNLKIGKNCWFGINSIISENVIDIEDYTILGTGSILTKSVLEKNTIFAGVPAKKIKNY